jgi:hypothetical protein
MLVGFRQIRYCLSEVEITAPQRQGAQTPVYIDCFESVEVRGKWFNSRTRGEGLSLSDGWLKSRTR